VFSQAWAVDGVHVGYRLREDGIATFTFAGSQCEQDWLDDFEALPWSHPYLGTLHRGFWQGMEDAFGVLKAPLIAAQGRVAVQGHSLGCAHAAILAGMCAQEGIAVGQLTLFAPPKPGYMTLRSIVEAHVPCRLAYQNGKWPFRDPVADVPETLPLFPWQGVVDLTPVCVRPKGLAKFNPFAYHEIALYEEAMRRANEVGGT
jgi:pimeloyl-ACP methyl ester carboxylesterase